MEMYFKAEKGSRPSSMIQINLGLEAGNVSSSQALLLVGERVDPFDDHSIDGRLGAGEGGVFGFIPDVGALEDHADISRGPHCGGPGFGEAQGSGSGDGRGLGRSPEIRTVREIERVPTDAPAFGRIIFVLGVSIVVGESEIGQVDVDVVSGPAPFELTTGHRVQVGGGDRGKMAFHAAGYDEGHAEAEKTAVEIDKETRAPKCWGRRGLR